MNDKQFEAFLEVANKISDNLEWIAMQTENIYSILVELRADYQNVNGLETDEELVDNFFEAVHKLKEKNQESDENVANIGGIE